MIATLSTRGKEAAKDIVDNHFAEMVEGEFDYGLRTVQAWLDFRGLDSGRDFARTVIEEGWRRTWAKEMLEVLMGDAYDDGDTGKAVELEAEYARKMKDKFRTTK